MFNAVTVKTNNYYSEVVLYHYSLPSPGKIEPFDWTDEDKLEFEKHIVNNNQTYFEDSSPFDTPIETKKDVSEEVQITRDYEEESRMRAKRKVMEYGRNNKWTHFCTFTFDDRKIPGIDINTEEGQKSVLNLFLKTIDNFKQTKCPELQYLVVPELGGKYKRLHFHGLFYLPDRSLLHRVKFNKKTQSNMYRINYFFKKFGANTLYEIKKDSVAVSLYCTKYITKSESIQINSHRYFASKGLQKDKVLVNMVFNVRISAAAVMLLDSRVVINSKDVFDNEYVRKYRLTHDGLKEFLSVFECMLNQYNGTYVLRKYYKTASSAGVPTINSAPVELGQMTFLM